jgi:hypothetical protein
MLEGGKKSSNAEQDKKMIKRKTEHRGKGKKEESGTVI